jgi:hypothetical protein
MTADDASPATTANIVAGVGPAELYAGEPDCVVGAVPPPSSPHIPHGRDKDATTIVMTPITLGQREGGTRRTGALGWVGGAKG